MSSDCRGRYKNKERLLSGKTSAGSTIKSVDIKTHARTDIHTHTPKMMHQQPADPGCFRTNNTVFSVTCVFLFLSISSVVQFTENNPYSPLCTMKNVQHNLRGESQTESTTGHEVTLYSLVTLQLSLRLHRRSRSLLLSCAKIWLINFRRVYIECKSLCFFLVACMCNCQHVVRA